MIHSHHYMESLTDFQIDMMLMEMENMNTDNQEEKMD